MIVLLYIRKVAFFIFVLYKTKNKYCMKINFLIISLFIVVNAITAFSVANDRHGSTGPGGGTTGLNISDRLLYNSNLSVEQSFQLEDNTV